MYQLVGTEPKTGRKIYYDQRGSVRLSLDRCPHCGTTDTVTYNLSTNLCDDCFRRKAYFYTQKRTVNRFSSRKTIVKFRDAIMFYIRLRDAGVAYAVPGDLDDLKERVDYFLASIDAGTQLIKADKFEVFTEPRICKDCGELVDEGVTYSSRVRCPSCTIRYRRYQQLTNRMAVLTDAECNELNDILDVYRENMMRGRWAPNIPVVRRRVRERAEELQVLRDDGAPYKP